MEEAQQSLDLSDKVSTITRITHRDEIVIRMCGL